MKKLNTSKSRNWFLKKYPMLLILIDLFCYIFEKGIQGYDFSIGEYKEVQYGDGNGFEELKVWFEDHNVPMSKEKPYTEFDEIDDLIEHIKEQLK